MRRCKILRVNSGISEEHLEEIYQRTKEFVKSNSYSFKSLVHLFKNASHLSRNTEALALDIIQKIRKDDSNLTPIFAIELLQGCANSEKFMMPKDYLLIDQILRTLPSLMKDMKIEHKSSLFQLVASFELYINPPRFKTPPILYFLKNSLKENIEQLKENDILKILEGYKYIPKEFQSDLLDEIKDVFIVTIQHNSANFKSNFILEFLEKMAQVLRFRKLSETRIHLIFDELAKRLPDDPFLKKFRNLEKIIEIYDKTMIKHPALINKVYETVQHIPEPFFSGPVLQCFTNHELNITPFLDKYINSKYFTKKADLQALRVFIVLSGLDTAQSKKYIAIKKDLMTQFLSNTADLNKFVTLIASSNIHNNEIQELLHTLIQAFKQYKESMNDIAFYKAMFQSVLSVELRKEWQDWAKENMNNLGPNQLQKLTDVIFSLNDLTQHQIHLYRYILSINKRENLPLKRILHGMKENRNFLLELSKMELYMESFLEKILIYMEAKKNDVRISTVFGVVKRIESTGLILPVTTTLLRKAYSISRELNLANSFSIETAVTLYLIDNGALKKEDAKHFYYEKCRGKKEYK